MEIVDVDRRVGIEGFEAFDILAHVAQPNGVDRGHLHIAVQLRLRLPNRRFQVVVLADQAFASLVVDLAGLS